VESDIQAIREARDRTRRPRIRRDPVKTHADVQFSSAMATCNSVSTAQNSRNERAPTHYRSQADLAVDLPIANRPWTLTI